MSEEHTKEQLRRTVIRCRPDRSSVWTEHIFDKSSDAAQFWNDYLALHRGIGQAKMKYFVSTQTEDHDPVWFEPMSRASVAAPQVIEGPSSTEYEAWLETRPDLTARFETDSFKRTTGYEIWRNSWLRLRELITASTPVAPSPTPEQKLDCPMCGARNAFVIDVTDPARGHCFVENMTWRVNAVGKERSND